MKVNSKKLGRKVSDMVKALKPSIKLLHMLVPGLMTLQLGTLEQASYLQGINKLFEVRNKKLNAKITKKQEQQ